jgi:hypothetical protein
LMSINRRHDSRLSTFNSSFITSLLRYFIL